MVAKNTGFSAWKLKYRQYRRLEHQRADALDQAAEHGLDQDTHLFETQLGYAKKLELLLGVHPWRKIKDAISAGTIAALCVGLIWFLSVIKMPVNSVTLIVESEAVNIDMPSKKPWSWTGSLPIADSPSLMMFNLDKDQDLERLMNSPADSILLKTLQTDGGGSILIGFDYDRLLNFRRNQGRLKGDLEFRPIGKKFSYKGSFNFNGNEAVSGLLKFMPKEEFRLEKIATGAVSFYRDVPTGVIESDRITESTVVKGTIRLKDNDQEIELRTGDGLRLEGCKGQISVVVMPETQRVMARFDGDAGKIIRDGSNLAPSLLSWGYHGQRPAFFSAVFLALWGMLWRIRKWLF